LVKPKWTDVVKHEIQRAPWILGLIVCLNTSNLYSETLHYAKSTLEQLGDLVEVFGLDWKFWGLATIPDKHPESNR
jgi:hypothetical protein